jgi:hypothetical protein
VWRPRWTHFVHTAPIPADDLDTLMRPEPLGESFAQAFSEQVDDLLPLQIHQDRAITLAFFQAQSSTPSTRTGGIGGGETALRHVKIVREAFSSLSPDRESDRAQRVQEACGPAGVERRQISKALGEQTQNTGRVGTKEPTHPEAQDHLAPSAGQVRHRSLIATVDAFGGGATLGTASRSSCGNQGDGESSRRAAQRLNGEPGW